MVTIGVDQSYTSSGVVVIKDGSVIDIKKIKAVGDDIFDKAENAATQICDIIVGYFHDHGDVAVAIEGLAFGMRGSATRDLAGLQFTIINKLRYYHGFDNIEIVSPLTLKKFATGSGKAKKEQMISSLPPEVRDKFNEYGVKKTTGLADLTDSYFLAKYLEHKRYV